MDKAEEFRRAFDASFALPLAPAAAELDDVLQVTVGAAPYAIRLSEIAGLVASRTLVTVPSTAPGLLGLAGIRGQIMPVFSLAALLGAADEVQSPPWLILSPAPDSLALGFSRFDGFLRLPRSAFHPAPSRRFSHEFITTEAGSRAVIAVPLVVESLRNRLGPSRPKEQ